MALDWHYPNQINPFDFQFQPHYQNDDETEFLCFDPLPPPPPLLNFDDPPSSKPLDHHQHHDFITPIDSCIEYSFPLHLIPEDYSSWDDNHSAQFLSFHDFRCFNNGAFPEFFDSPKAEVGYDVDFRSGQEFMVMGEEQINHNSDSYQSRIYGNDIISGGNMNNNGKIKDNKVTAKSKTARERRKKIKEKTNELGKLIPGSSKMNTAEMFQAGIKYVKFLQAQLTLLQSINTLQKVNEKEFIIVDAKLNNLPIVTSQLVQEKLYARDKCLVPLDMIPLLQEHCDFEILPSISQHINQYLY